MIPRLHELSTTQTHYLDFIETLKKRGFEGELSPDYANRVVLATDNSIYQVLPQGVIYPKHAADIVLLCQLSNEKTFQDITLSPRGGGTGTNGQSLTDGLVVDLSKHMNGILEINVKEKWVRVQTGVVKDQLNTVLKAHGLFFAPELSTSNRATLGGMINTDASGQGSCVYGKTRDHVLELQTVLLDGSIITSKPLSSDEFTAISEHDDRAGLIHRLVNSIDQEHHALIEEKFPKLNRCLTGYDLAHIRDEHKRFNLNNILCGSEGTLGFITEAKLNVLPTPRHSALVIVKYNDFQASLRDATELMKAGPISIETIDSKVLNLAMNDFSWSQVEEFFAEATPVPVQGINLVEYVGDSLDEIQKSIDGLVAQIQNSIATTANTTRIGVSVAMGNESVKKIWAMRKQAVGLLGNSKGEARPVPFVEDTAVPPENLADFIMEFRAILDEYKLNYGMFGHVDAGVLHVRPALDMKDPAQEKIAWEISDRVADLTQRYDGLLWGEHGKGVRSEYAPKFFGELYPQLQRIKHAFDPRNQLNPGKIATPAKGIELLKINEVTTRGQTDRHIPVQMWDQFKEAVYCNGNGVCFNWNTHDPMCPSWKGTRERVNSPKGRASLIREWLRLLADKKTDTTAAIKPKGILAGLLSLPNKINNSIKKSKGEYDFSNEVYDSMSACLSCKACAGQCPIKVDVPEFRSKFLALYHTRYMRPMKDYLVASLEHALPIFAFVPWLYNFFMNLKSVTWFLEKYIGFVDGPLYAKASFKKADLHVATTKRIQRLNESDRKNAVVIVQDAFTSYFETHVVIDIANFLRSLGFYPLLAPYKPNGKPMHVHGFLSGFKRAASANAKSLLSIHSAGIPLIGVDPSMTLTYRNEYKKHLEESDVPPVHLIQEWLHEHIEKITKHKTTQSQTFKLMTHCTEQSNATGSNKQWQAIFKALGHSLEILQLGCCGMAGTYGHEARNRETSSKIYELSWKDTVQQHVDSGQLIATGYSCRSQVKREDQKNILHPIQALLNI